MLIGVLALLALTIVGGTVALVVRTVVGARDVPDEITDQGRGRPPKPDRNKPGRDKPDGPRPDRGRKDRGEPPDIGRPTDLSELAQQVAQIRELDLRRRLRSRLVEPEELANKISALAFSDLNPKEVENDERLLVALRLAPEGFDLAQMTEDLYREQVLGVYVPEERTLYVGRRGEASPAQQTTTAHEITHALQDQTFDMVRLQKKYKDDADASLAVLSLIEGDAVLTQQLWAQEYLTTEQQQQAAMEGAGGGDALARVPDYLRAGLFFPYSRGSFFVADLYSSGGYDAVDAAFRDPPTTTEQILHPERYRERDEAVKVRVGNKPGAGWKHATTYAFGEFDLRELFGVLGSGTASVAGEGWDGGEVRSWSKGAATSVGAVLVFDTAADATEVCDAVPQWYAEVAGGREIGDGIYAGDGDHLAYECGGTQVRFGLAPARETARRLSAAP